PPLAHLREDRRALPRGGDRPLDGRARQLAPRGGAGGPADAPAVAVGRPVREVDRPAVAECAARPRGADARVERVTAADVPAGVAAARGEAPRAHRPVEDVVA